MYIDIYNRKENFIDDYSYNFDINSQKDRKTGDIKIGKIVVQDEDIQDKGKHVLTIYDDGTKCFYLKDHVLWLKTRLSEDVKKHLGTKKNRIQDLF